MLIERIVAAAPKRFREAQRPSAPGVKRPGPKQGFRQLKSEVESMAGKVWDLLICLYYAAEIWGVQVSGGCMLAPCVHLAKLLGMPRAGVFPCFRAGSHTGTNMLKATHLFVTGSW